MFFYVNIKGEILSNFGGINNMFPIVKKRKLAENIYLFDVLAKRVAAKCLPGEFVIVKQDKQGERIPLTICDYDREAGTVTIVIQVIGGSTKLITEGLNE